MLNLLPSNLC